MMGLIMVCGMESLFLEPPINIICKNRSAEFFFFQNPFENNHILLGFKLNYEAHTIRDIREIDQYVI
jgi:hypothetical protein